MHYFVRTVSVTVTVTAWRDWNCNAIHVGALINCVYTNISLTSVYFLALLYELCFEMFLFLRHVLPDELRRMNRFPRMCRAAVCTGFVEVPCVKLSKLLRTLWGICVSVSTALRGGPNSVVRVVTCFGRDGPGIEFRWGEIFRIHIDRPIQPHVQWVPSTFPVDKAAGAGAGYRVPSPGVALTIHPF
jgi:hypothetical protein